MDESGHANESAMRTTKPELENTASQNSVSVVSATTKQETHLMIISCVVFLFLNTDFHMQEMWAVPTSFIFAIEFMYKQPKFQIRYFMVIK